MFLPLTFSSLTSHSKQKVAVLPGSKNAYVCSILLPFLALICIGRIGKTQSCALYDSYLVFLAVCALNGCGGCYNVSSYTACNTDDDSLCSCHKILLLAYQVSFLLQFQHNRCQRGSKTASCSLDVTLFPPVHFGSEIDVFMF